jgi:hypothetical protein
MKLKSLKKFEKLNTQTSNFIVGGLMDDHSKNHDIPTNRKDLPEQI